LYPRDRKIIVEDNATGIKELDFKRVMGSVGDSDKELGKDKGFRGIGRLCGLAYCKRLVFTTRWNGESNVSVMACDALKMRQMINETNMKVQRYSINDVLTAMTEFSAHPTSANDPEHFFRVELIDINNENEELFGGRDEDNIKQLTDYLSFVAPGALSSKFLKSFRNL
jgi:molecular chaperone HtpG